LNELYEILTKEMKGMKGYKVEDLKKKLDAIRSNKQLLESRIKDYEQKLYKH